MRPAYIGLRRRDQAPGRHRHASNRPVCGRKLCALCGRWRHLCDFRPKGARPYPYCRGCEATRLREHFHSMTPEQRERRNEYARIRWDVKARAAGKPKRYRQRTVVDRRERILLPRDPLVVELDRLDGDLQNVARRSGVPPRSIQRLRHDGGRWVQLDTADKLAHAMGIPLELLYRGQGVRE